ncbi:MAG: hypothetical protein J6P57_09575 [Lachnospiraceae bacterium]|nr:hypothetical protein [Lachnospiraceae bacterium]
MRLKRFAPIAACVAALLFNNNLPDIYAASIENNDSTVTEENVEMEEEEILTNSETNGEDDFYIPSEDVSELNTEKEEFGTFPDEEIINADMSDDETSDDEIQDDSLYGSWYDKYIKDSDGRLIKKEIYTISGVLSYTEEYEYDSKGNKVKMTRKDYVTFGDDEGKLNYLYVYEYSTDGKKKKLTYTEYVFGSITATLSQGVRNNTYLFDSRGFCISDYCVYTPSDDYVYASPTGEKLISKGKYEYKDDGTPTKASINYYHENGKIYCNLTYDYNLPDFKTTQTFYKNDGRIEGVLFLSYTDGSGGIDGMERRYVYPEGGGWITLDYNGGHVPTKVRYNADGSINNTPLYDESWYDSSLTPGVDMYRLYNPNSGEHFYTADANEKDFLVGVGWNYEGIGWRAPVSSNTPVYRLYNSNAGDHHYTMSKGERDYLVSVGWNYEGIGWYSDDLMSVPLYRQYNPNAVTGSHNYTISKSENDMLVSVGWNDEGIGWYGLVSNESYKYSVSECEHKKVYTDMSNVKRARYIHDYDGGSCYCGIDLEPDGVWLEYHHCPIGVFYLSTDEDTAGMGSGWQGPNQRIAPTEGYLIERCRDCGAVRKVDVTGNLDYFQY